MRASLPGVVRNFLLSAALATAAGAPAAADIPDDALRGNWCEVVTPHVRVLSDAGLARANHVAERIERLHEQVARTAGSLSAEPARPRIVFLFRDRATFRAYLPLYRGRPEEDTGLFQPTPAAGYLLLQDGPDAELDPVTLHECTHAILFDFAPNAPVWLNEGLAEYFSTFRVDDADARVGEPVPELLAWIQRHDLLAVEDLMGVNAGSADYHEGDRRATFYAQSWLLVHMLLNESVEDLPRFERYLGALHGGDEPRAAFRATYGEERRIQWRLEIYSHRPSFSGMNWSFSRPFSRLRVAAHDRVPNADVLVALGSMLAWRREEGPAAAEEHARAALVLAPDDPGALQLVRALVARRAIVDAARTTPEALPPDPDREQRAVEAFNLGVQALERRDVMRAIVQFRSATSLTARPELREKARHAVGLIVAAGHAGEVGEVSALLRNGRRAEARRKVRALLEGDLEPTLRQGLLRLDRALAAARAAP